MSSATVIDALEKRGYISAEARDRLTQKRASVIINHISEQMKLAGIGDFIRPMIGNVAGRTASRTAGGIDSMERFGRSMAGNGMGRTASKGWPEWLAGIGRVMGVGAGLAAGGAAVGAAGHAIENIGLKKKIKESKGQVIGLLAEKNPEVKRQQEEVFDAVARYAPTLASDPLIATGIVQGIAKGTGGMSRNLPHVDANFAKGLAEAETRINESRTNTRFGKMHQEAHKGVAGQFDFGDKPQRG